MRKSNRINEKRAIARGLAQGKRLTKTRAPRRRAAAAPAVVSTFRPLEITPWRLPYHRLLPRSRAELRALQRFTANLGVPVVSCVFQGGYIDHIFRGDGGTYFRVNETFTVPGHGEKFHDITETLQDRGESLAKFLARRQRLKMERVFFLDAISTEDVAQWVEETGSIPARREELERLFGRDEAADIDGGRVIHEWKRGGATQRILARCGVYTWENSATGEKRPLTREDVASLLHLEFLNPMLSRLLHPSVRFEFDIQRKSNHLKPADPADVMK